MFSAIRRFGVANSISTLRMAMSLVVVYALFLPEQRAICFWLTALIIWMDGLDGYAARKLGETSTFGAVYDILCDRVVELIFWIAFLALGWVALWVPLVVTVRGVLVDGIRGIALQQGFTAFGAHSMMQHPIGVLLVSSRFSRWTYAVCKALVFCLLIAAHIPASVWPLTSFLPDQVAPIADGLVWITVGFCVVRGLPVLLAAPKLISAVVLPERQKEINHV
jgi:phosphatidylglycerophosphate synthase